MASFKDVPVGTKCFVETRHGWYITYVTRHTKTQVVTKTSEDAPEGKFRIDDGYQVGNDKWTYTRLEVFTDRHQTIVDKYKLTKKLTAVLANLSKNINSLTKEDLEVLESIEV